MVTRKCLHKRILALFTVLMLMISSISFSFAEKAINDVVVEDFSLTSANISEISGDIIFSNNSATETQGLWYATFLYRDYFLGTSDLINFQVRPLKMLENQMKRIIFHHEIPFDIPQGSYSMIVKVYNSNGEVLSTAFQEVGVLGYNIPFLQLDSLNSYFVVNGSRIDLMNSPKFQKGLSPTIKLNVINSYADAISARAKVNIYKKSPISDEQPVQSIILPELINIDSGKTQQVDINIPSIADPDSYYANIILVNEKDVPVSGLIEAKYIVSASGARILHPSVSYSMEKLVVNASVIGAMGEGKLIGVKMLVEACEIGGQSIYKDEKYIDIGSNSEDVIFEKNMKIKAKSIIVKYKLDYNGSTLFSTDLSYDIYKYADIITEEDFSPNVRVTPKPTKIPTPTQIIKPTLSAPVTITPTIAPTRIPILVPITTPTVSPKPTVTPTKIPTPIPTIKPTATPTIKPTATPTIEPTATPTIEPIPTDTNTSKDGWEEESLNISTPVPTPMPTAKPLPKPTPDPSVLLDVKGTVFERPVFELYKLGIVKGHENNKYYPTGKLSRAEFLVMMLKLLNNGEELVPDNSGCPFVDVDPSYWAYGYLKQGYNSGLFKGYPGGLFKPDASVSYAEVLAVCGNIISTVEQRNEMKKWPEDIVNYAKSKNLSKGMIYNYFEKVSRGNVAQILYDLHKLIKASQ